MAETTDPVVNTPDATASEVEKDDTAVVVEVVAQMVNEVVEDAETNPRGLLKSPFVSTSTISTLNSIQFEVDIAPHVNPPRVDDEEEQHQMQVLGFCAFMSKCIIGVVVLSCLLIAGCWYTK